MSPLFIYPSIIYPMALLSLIFLVTLTQYLLGAWGRRINKILAMPSTSSILEVETPIQRNNYVYHLQSCQPPSCSSQKLHIPLFSSLTSKSLANWLYHQTYPECNHFSPLPILSWSRQTLLSLIWIATIRHNWSPIIGLYILTPYNLFFHKRARIIF